MHQRKIIPVLALLSLLVMALGVNHVSAQTSPALWFASYWNNPDLQGEPAYQTSTGNIDYNWGTGSPAPGIEADTWSARWTTFADFAPGTYRFTATSDDGVRLYFGDKHIISDWSKHPARTYVVTVSLTGGRYPIAVDYFDDVGGAQLKVGWENVGPPVAGAGDVTVISTGTTPPPQVPTPQGNWTASYWNNTSLQGNAVLTRSEMAVDHNWGTGSPAPGIIAPDNFSARWTRDLPLSAGRYRFTVTADDGVRVWVNNQLVIDQWRDQNSATYSAEIDLPSGNIPVRVEYYERGHEAEIHLSWTAVSGGGPIANWRGEYFANPNLSGAPALVRDDAAINFDWGYGAPATTLPADGFSARWTRTLELIPGRYRFTATSDDGVRVWVNNQLIIDNWSQHAAQTVSADVDIAGTAVPVRVEFFEATGQAQLQFNWTRLGPAADTGGTPVATVTAYRLNVRQGPGVEYTRITTLDEGTQLQLIARDEAAVWVQAILPDGTIGWVHSNYIASPVPIATLPVG